MLDGDLNSRGGLAREEVRRLLEALAGRADPLRLDFPYLSPTSFRLLVGRARLIDDVKPRGLNDDIVENDLWNTHSVPFP